MACVNPHGSKRDGTASTSPPAMNRCAQRLVVTDVQRDAPRMRRRRLAETGLQLAVAGAEHGQLAARVEQIGQSGEQQIHAQHAQTAG